MVDPYRSALPLISNGIACAIGCKTSPPALRVASFASFGNSGIFDKRSNGTFRSPRIVSLLPAIVLSKEHLFVLSEIVVHILRDEIMLVGQAECLARCI